MTSDSKDNTLSDEHQNEISKLLREKIEIKDLCASLGILYAEGKMEHSGGSVQTITQSLDTEIKNVGWIGWLKQNKPDFILIEPRPLPERENLVISRIADVLDDETKKLLPLYDYLASLHCQQPTFDIYCFFKSISIRVKYSWVSLLDPLYLETTNFDDEWVEDDDEGGDEAYRTLERDEIIKYSNEISKLPNFSSARTIAQRNFFVSEHFASLGMCDIDEYQIGTIAHSAGVRFDMEVLPNRVKELKDSGLSDKQISEATGQSINKIKRILG